MCKVFFSPQGPTPISPASRPLKPQLPPYQLSQHNDNRDMWLGLRVTNDLIYNESTRIVTIFKDYLILDDVNEFLKRGYSFLEAC
jgi:hypothetical protein